MGMHLFKDAVKCYSASSEVEMCVSVYVFGYQYNISHRLLQNVFLRSLPLVTIDIT